MAWLSVEEGLLFVAIITAAGLLVVGTLRLIWPTRPPVAPARDRFVRSLPTLAPPVPPVLRSPRIPSPAGGHVVRPPDDRAAVPRDRAAMALRLGRTLLDRALQDADPASERRRTLIYRAISCLNRGVEAAPDDDVLRVTLGSAHAALWHTYEQVGRERLAQETPWRATVLGPAPATPPPLKADTATRP